MASGPFNDPNYTIRQSLLLGKSTAGANTSQYATGGIVFPFDVRIRNALGVVGTTGGVSSVQSGLIIYCPGTSIQFPAMAGAVAANGSAATTLTTNTTTTTLGF